MVAVRRTLFMFVSFFSANRGGSLNLYLYSFYFFWQGRNLRKIRAGNITVCKPETMSLCYRCLYYGCCAVEQLLNVFCFQDRFLS